LIFVEIMPNGMLAREKWLSGAISNHDLMAAIVRRFQVTSTPGAVKMRYRLP
jgi:hypothetical protein